MKSLVKCQSALALNQGLTERMAPISSLYCSRLRESRVGEGNVDLDLKCDSGFSNIGVGNQRKEVRGTFYNPSLRCYYWDVGDPDLSGPGGGTRPGGMLKNSKFG
jgi:hypothetical protein